MDFLKPGGKIVFHVNVLANLDNLGWKFAITMSLITLNLENSHSTFIRYSRHLHINIFF